MKYQKYQGIIINRTSVKDGDRFLTIYTKSVGKISVYARSVRSTKSKRTASLDLYNHIKFEVVSRGNHKTLTHVEIIDSYKEGKKKLSDISRLFVIGELIDAFLQEEDENQQVFELLLAALSNLSSFDSPQYLIRFKKKLLLILGYGEVKDQELDSYIESLLDRQLRAGQML